MANQVLVIGLGQFGLSLVEALAMRGMEVLAVDRKPELVERASAFTDEVVALDATDRNALAGLDPARRDVSVCAIGNENREGSILCTALLRELGAKHILARATDVLHERILRAVGAHEVVNPEREFGFHLAPRFVYRGFVGGMRLGPDLHIAEFQIPSSWVDHTLQELDIRKRRGVNIVALRTAEGHMVMPGPDHLLSPGDVVVAVGRPHDIDELMRGMQ